ncbi:DM13 domain-containing protein [Enterovibrio paralichthyis]|uniref:DM13 domain-containing protein n=1 Tax=Enterovibrio paralichthyis TaxID=2853805 RepID=UPI001C4523E0|nr:DM13 domain-containing protein [Enterovibrio paralichthyis]MBV7300185.1 DM13 domain-containing protein [Enterovibrio paralichthyis]
MTKNGIILFFTHLFTLIIGFAAGIYALPILIAPEGPSVEVIETSNNNATFTGEFRKDLIDSDTFHWGEGVVTISPDTISLIGELAPGPDYKLYLSPQFVETEADFNRLKPQMQRVGDVKTFENFLVNVPQNIDPAQYNTVVIWCESFGEFITAARYQ